MAPLGAAVDLVDDQAGKSSHSVHLLQLGHEAFTLGQFLWGHEQKSQRCRFVYHGILDGGDLVFVSGGIQHRGVYVVVFQSNDLVLHQGHQRGDNQGHTYQNIITSVNFISCRKKIQQNTNKRMHISVADPKLILSVHFRMNNLWRE